MTLTPLLLPFDACSYPVPWQASACGSVAQRIVNTAQKIKIKRRSAHLALTRVNRRAPPPFPSQARKHVERRESRSVKNGRS